jgi:tetratricopeptide (TPR) repeat protein
LGIAEQAQGKADSAIAHFTTALERAPTALNHYHLGVAYQLRRAYPEAVAAFTKAASMAGDDPHMQARIDRSRGESLAAMGEVEEARAAFAKALERVPDDPVTLNSRGWFLFAAKGDHRSAIADYDRAIQLNPNYSYAFNNRGWSRYRLGDKDGALSDIGKAKKRKIFNPFIYRNLGIIALEGRDTVLACTHFRRALEYNFTAMFGNEVQELADKNCRNENKGAAPVQAPHAPMDRPDGTPPVRTNAP